MFFGKGAERFGKVGLFNNQEIIDNVIVTRNESNSPLERIFANRPAYITRKIFNNYLSAFSPEFLFIRGDITARHSLQYMGQLLPVWAPFLVLGLIYLIKQKARIWLIWLLLAPIPAALTYDGAYHATRLFMMIPPLAVAVGGGILWILQLLPKKIAVFTYFVVWMVIAFQFIDAGNYYIFHYPKITWRWWHVGFKTAIEEIVRLSPDYSQVFINNTYEPSLIRFLFYSSYPPSQFQKNFTLDQPKADISPNYYGFFLDPKYFFGTFTFPPNKSLPDVIKSENLYLVSQRDDIPGNWDWRTTAPGGVKVLFTSTNPLGDPVFYLITKSE